MKFVKKHIVSSVGLVIALTCIASYLAIFPFMKVSDLKGDDLVFYCVASGIYVLFFLSLFILFAYIYYGKKRKRMIEQAIKDAEAIEEEPTNVKQVVVHANPKLIKALHMLRSSDRKIREDSVELIVQAIEEQDKRAAVLLAIMYERGIVVPKDTDKAIDIYNIAIELGSKNAYLLKAKLFEGKEEVISTYNAKKAAEAGIPEGLNYLGNKYFYHDYQKASMLYDLAIDRGSDYAIYNHALLSYKHGKTKDTIDYWNLYTAKTNN